MRILSLLMALAVSSALSSATGWAASPSKSADDHGAATDHSDEKLAPGPTVVEIPIIVIPVANETGRIIKYGYLIAQLEIPRPNDRWYVESRIPYIKDMFIRELHKYPNTLPSNSRELDVEGVRQRLADRAHEMVGDRVGTIIFKDLAFPPPRFRKVGR